MKFIALFFNHAYSFGTIDNASAPFPFFTLPRIQFPSQKPYVVIELNWSKNDKKKFLPNAAMEESSIKSVIATKVNLWPMINAGGTKIYC